MGVLAKKKPSPRIWTKPNTILVGAGTLFLLGMATGWWRMHHTGPRGRTGGQLKVAHQADDPLHLHQGHVEEQDHEREHHDRYEGDHRAESGAYEHEKARHHGEREAADHQETAAAHRVEVDRHEVEYQHQQAKGPYNWKQLFLPHYLTEHQLSETEAKLKQQRTINISATPLEMKAHDVIYYHAALSPIGPPIQPVAVPAFNKSVAHCGMLPELAGLPKIEYQRRVPQPSQVSPQKLFAMLAGVAVPAKLPKKHRSTVWRDAHRTSVFTSAAEGTTRPDLAVPRTANILYPYPLRVGPSLNVTAYNLEYPVLPYSKGPQANQTKPEGFGLWKTNFVSEDIVKTHPERAQYPQRTLPQPPMYYSIFKRAWISDGNVVTCTNAFTTGACMFKFEPFPLSTETSLQRGTIVAFCDFWCNGYFHFTHEHLPRLATVHHLLMRDRSIQITAPRRTKFIMAYLVDIFGIHDSQILPRTGKSYAAANVIYPQPQRCGSIFTSTLLLLRKIAFQRLGLISGGEEVAPVPSTALPVNETASNFTTQWWEAPAHNVSALPIIVLAERDLKKLDRMPSNYHDLKGALMAKYQGQAEFISTRGLSVRQQVKLFFKAAMVIGAHGANIANIMWMRHGAYVVEFMSYKYANMCYFGTASRLGLRFGAVFHENGKDGKYNTSLAEIAMHVDSALDPLDKET